MDQDLRPLLFSIAYGIVGSVSEAEDLVQEAFLCFHREQGEDADINSPRAWLSTVATRRGHQGGLSRSQASCTASSASLSQPRSGGGRSKGCGASLKAPHHDL